MSRNILFITANTIKERTSLHENVDEKLVLPEILTVQDMFFIPILGTALYERLQDGIELNNLTVNEVSLLDKYITNALVFYTMSELPMGLSYQFYSKGLSKKTSTNTDMPSAKEMMDVADRYKSRAEYYSQRLIKYLKQTASSTIFPQYLSPGSGVDTITPDNSAYQTTIYLGEYDTKKTYEQKYQGNRCGE